MRPKTFSTPEKDTDDCKTEPDSAASDISTFETVSRTLRNGDKEILIRGKRSSVTSFYSFNQPGASASKIFTDPR